MTVHTAPPTRVGVRAVYLLPVSHWSPLTDGHTCSNAPCPLQEFTAGCNKIYVKVLLLLRPFIASSYFWTWSNKTGQGRRIAFRCIQAGGGRGGRLVSVFLTPPHGPWGAGRAAAETKWGSSFVNGHQSLLSVSPITPNLWPRPTLSRPGFQGLQNGIGW